MLQHNGYSGTVEVSVEDNCLHGRVLHIDDLITYEAATPAHLCGAFIAAVNRYLSHCKSIGKRPDKPYSGTFNVRIGADRHRAVAGIAQARNVSINEALCQLIDLSLAGVTDHLEIYHTHEVVVSLSQSQGISGEVDHFQVQAWSSGELHEHPTSLSTH